MVEAPNKNKQEQKIKNRLRLIQMEESREHSFSLNPYLNPRPLPLKSADFRDISDWTQQNTWNLHQKPSKRQSRPNMASTRYQSALLHDTHKKTRLELSPIVVKFNAKILSQNLQQSKELHLRRIKQNPYLTYYKEKQMKRHQSNTQHEPLNRLSDQKKIKQLPKTERISSILRLMKRNYARKRSSQHNPQHLTTRKM